MIYQERSEMYLVDLHGLSISAGFHYAMNHWNRQDSDGKLMDDYCQTLNGIKVIQMNELCGTARSIAKSNWVQWRQTQGDVGW